MPYGNLFIRTLISGISKPQKLPVRGMIFAANHHFNFKHNRKNEFLAQNFLHSGIMFIFSYHQKNTLIEESMADREIKSKRQKLDADIAEKNKDIEVISFAITLFVFYRSNWTFSLYSNHL